MDIQNFIAEFKKTFIYDMLKDYVTDEKLFDHFVTENGDIVFLKEQTRQMWSMWQAAKAQAVPEGFVLINKSDRNQEMLELIDQRDYMESQAEELKDKLQALYGVDFGEHSNCNFPFQNAIDYDDSDLVLVPKKPSEEFLSKAIRKYLEVSDLSVITSRMAHLYELMIKEAQEPAND